VAMRSARRYLLHDRPSPPAGNALIRHQALDVFDHHDGVIDQQSDRQHDGEQVSMLMEKPPA